MRSTDPHQHGLLKHRWLRRVHDLCGALYWAHLGVVLRILLVVALAIFPVAHEFHYLESRWWLLGWGIVFAAREVGVYYLAGLGTQNLTKRIARVNRDVGGNIDSIARKVAPNHAKKPHRLTESESHVICMSLLARVLDVTLNEYPTAEPSDVRVTIAVPVLLEGFTEPTTIRVWCYDRPHDDSRWTSFALPAANDVPIAGAIDAFVSNEIRIIRDIWNEPGAVDVGHTRYRSVVCIPVRSGGPGDKPCAVVNIDAVAPDFFAEDIVRERILPLATPMLSTISFVLRLREPGATFHFGN